MRHVDDGGARLGGFLRHAEQPRLLAFLAVQDVAAGDEMLPGAHELGFDEILDQLDLQLLAVGHQLKRFIDDGRGEERNGRRLLGRQLVVGCELELRLECPFQCQ